MIIRKKGRRRKPNGLAVGLAAALLFSGCSTGIDAVMIEHKSDGTIVRTRLVRGDPSVSDKVKPQPKMVAKRVREKVEGEKQSQNTDVQTALAEPVTGGTDIETSGAGEIEMRVEASMGVQSQAQKAGSK